VKLKKPLPKWAPLVGIVVVGLIVAAGGWMFVISPQNKKAADLTTQAAAVRQKIQTQLAAVAAAKSAAATPAQTIRVADVYKLVKAMPDTDDVPDLLIELSQITKDAGVTVQTLSPSASSHGANGGDTIPISLNVEGDFYSITDLLYRLRNLVFVRNGSLEANGRLFSIDTVSLAPSGTTKITASITMHAYTYGAPAPALPAVPAVPASTDTTSTDTTTTPSSSSGPSATGAP
jgi:Tfp pilus assembly protein PilO